MRAPTDGPAENLEVMNDCPPVVAGRQPDAESKSEDDQTATIEVTPSTAANIEAGHKEEQCRRGRSQRQVPVDALERECDAGQRDHSDQHVAMAEEDGLGLRLELLEDGERGRRRRAGRAPCQHEGKEAGTGILSCRGQQRRLPDEEGRRRQATPTRLQPRRSALQQGAPRRPAAPRRIGLLVRDYGYGSSNERALAPSRSRNRPE